MRAIFMMPTFVNEAQARAMGEACGLKLVEWEKFDWEKPHKGTGHKATFSCETQDQIDTLSRDLSYGPEQVHG